MGRRWRGGEEFISRNHGGLAGWFLPSKANPRCGRQRRRRPPWTFGPCIYIYFIRVFFPRVSNFSFHPPSRGCLARISPCPSNNLTRVAGSSGSYRKKYYRETDERYIYGMNERCSRFFPLQQRRIMECFREMERVYCCTLSVCIFVNGKTYSCWLIVLVGLQHFSFFSFCEF